ncbi:hypothetical protein [Persicobacter sp. CCB-QB2]|uniref:TlpA family protein disulfide reductase n=1 Tax=Persicobacter sp. CCB-QB2 TaxID=1561025 RepID=UPI0006A9EEE0|nr:hypothetical protein [Persicobacter sp. CCB-QB2]
MESLSISLESITSIVKDHKLLLLLFYNNDCLGCTGRAIPFAHQLDQEFPELKVVGVHSNFGKRAAHNEQELLSIFRAAQAPFELFIDADHQLYDALNCEGTPHWALFDARGSSCYPSLVRRAMHKIVCCIFWKNISRMFKEISLASGFKNRQYRLGMDDW